MSGCAVRCCKNWDENTNDKTIQYYPFPQDPIIAQKWLEACNVDNFSNLQSGKICLFVLI